MATLILTALGAIAALALGALAWIARAIAAEYR